MKSLFLRCPVCVSDRQEVLFPGFMGAFNSRKVEIDDFQNIVICNDCGAIARNPVIPDLNNTLYSGGPQAWGNDDDQKQFDDRLSYVSSIICEFARLRPGDLVIDIGGGPGWLTKRLTEKAPGIRALLCEPIPENGIFAKGHTPGLITVPSRLDEFETGENMFALVTATGVDYLFVDHRAALQKIQSMLKDDGTFYIERNVFVDQQSYYKQPIFDHEDLFGINHKMNFWPGREQFIEYLSTFFDVSRIVDYDFGETLGYRCQMYGAFCRKGNSDIKPKRMTNYYEAHLRELQTRALKSSIDDLKWLSDRGLKRIGIFGEQTESSRLKEIIDLNQLFEVSFVGGLDDRHLDLASAEAVFVTSIGSYTSHEASLRERGYQGKIYSSLRPGLQNIDATTSAGNRIQMKAFLPAYIAGERK